MDAPVGYSKEADAVKLFVGQIPKTFDEAQIREIMESYGPIYDITVIKDRVTGVHKGCSFVTYCSKQSSLDAQQALHEKRTLPMMNHPMQVKPAISEGRAEDRRLFVGMLSKTCSENDVRVMFTAYGVVEDVSILRNPDGSSKGAAFVRLGTKLQAQNAISTMHQCQTMPGASAPLVVKIADTEREKAQKKLQQALTTSPGIAAIGGLNAALGLGSLSAAAYYQQLLQLQQAQAAATGTGASNSFGLGTSGIPGNIQLSQIPQQTTASGATFGAAQHGGLGNLGAAVLSATANNPTTKTIADPIVQAYLGMQYPAFGQPQVGAPYLHQKQKDGPEGSNLFIYHLPNDVTDNDLIQMFAPFGNVLSAKVFIDKVTSLSKCFGFVSYDNPQAAQSAIQAMNGFQIGTKRLKVQLKRPKDANKPYW